jgi:murein DD-endopeptidase MepM/ murein hydrolase activator NlpD
MLRRLALVLLAVLLTAGGATAQTASERKRQIDQRIDALRGKIAEAQRKEGVLTTEISAVTAKIRTLQGEVDSAAARLATIESELAVHEARLENLNELFALQTKKLKLMQRQHAVAQQRLGDRLRAIYESEDPTPLEVVLSATSIADMLDQLQYVSVIGQQDKRIAREVAHAKREVTVARRETAATRTEVAETTRVVRARAQEQRAERDGLVANREQLASARQEKERTLAAVQATEEEYLHEVEGLERASAGLRATIQAAQARSVPASVSGVRSAPLAVNPGGFVWPVHGPVTSTFGWRWGRMHEGVDIGAATGSPIVAVASGTVIYAGWMDGYGQLVVVDHGGGLSTAYAHMSTIGASVGIYVGQGQTIGYVGCTGHCYGSHLHFEVRVNGSPVDPLGYL